MMVIKRGHLKKDVTKGEYHWIAKDLKKGKVVYKYYGQTYGCITGNGIAVSNKPGKNPFYEIPEESVKWD